MSAVKLMCVKRVDNIIKIDFVLFANVQEIWLYTDSLLGVSQNIKHIIRADTDNKVVDAVFCVIVKH